MLCTVVLKIIQMFVNRGRPKKTQINVQCWVKAPLGFTFQTTTFFDTENKGLSYEILKLI